jgi:hypothetical protein
MKLAGPSDEYLELLSNDSSAKAFAMLWDDRRNQRADAIRRRRGNERGLFKLYLLYSGEPPSSEEWKSLRDTMNCDVIPLESNVLDRALSEGSSAERLRDIEEPFVVLTDPYHRTNAQSDPTFFFGRQDVLEEIPRALRQGQHSAILGLRRIGKTSVLRQIENHLLRVPFASFEIISHESAIRLLTRVLDELHTRMMKMHLKKVPQVEPISSDSDFRERFLRLYACWEETGSREPFILILDEAERLFPSREDPANEPELIETAHFFRVLRALAQERQCLAICAAAYRPNLNRWNKLTPRAGENALFQQYREVFLGPLDGESTRVMLAKLGLPRGIEWTEDALDAAYRYSGGHPQLARFFASDVSGQGTIMKIDAARVHETANEIRRDFRRHRIFTLLKESIWAELRPDERKVLLKIVNGLESDPDDADALTDLQLFGVVRNYGSGYDIGAQLLMDWLKLNVN